MPLLSQIQRSPVERITVENWADIGPQYYGPMNEDGERPIRNPDPQWLVVVEVNGGELYTKPAASAAVAEAWARVIDAKGSVNLDRWHFWRVVYGSEAYVNGDYEQIAIETEMEEERWAGSRW